MYSNIRRLRASLALLLAPFSVSYAQQCSSATAPSPYDTAQWDPSNVQIPLQGQLATTTRYPPSASTHEPRLALTVRARGACG